MRHPNPDDRSIIKKLLMPIFVFAALIIGAILLVGLKPDYRVFLTIIQNPADSDIRTSLVIHGNSYVLPALMPNDKSKVIFNSDPTTEPYKLGTQFFRDEKINESISVSVNAEKRDIVLLADGFGQYSSLSITIDNHPLLTDKKFDWSGKFQAPIIYYTKPDGFLICFNAFKKNKTEKIEWCHSIAEAKQV